MLRAPKGTDDILPPISREWRQLLSLWEDWSARFGYDLTLTPLFESTEVFARGVGESTDVVQKQMYTFADKKGRSLTLRPEGTASVVRAYIQAGSLGEMKASYSGPMFRYEQPQAGRRRQFYQVGVEYLGADSAAADAEVIELGYRYLTDAGVSGLVVMLNSLGDSACRPAYLETLKNWLGERQEELCADSVTTMAINPMRVLDCKVCADVVVDAPVPADYLCEPCEERSSEVRDYLSAREVPYTNAPRLVRGLDYYTRTTFEFVATKLDAAQNAVGGGGRYDGLAEALGGPKTPGVGLALGLDRIVLARTPSGTDVVLDAFVVAQPEQWDRALTLVSQLRMAGLRSDATSAARSLKAQMKVAQRLAACYVVIVDDSDVVNVRCFASGEDDIQTDFQEVATWLMNHL